MRHLLLFGFIFITSSHGGLTQSTLPKKVADSLWNTWKNEAKPDTVRLDAIYNFIRKGYLFSKPDSAYYFSNLQYNFAKKQGLKSQMADALILQGISLSIRGNYSKAIEIYFRSLSFFEELNDKVGAARVLGNIGVLYQNKGEDNKAIENFTKSLQFFKAIEDPVGIAKSLNNIAVIHIGKGELDKAINYCFQSLRIEGEANDAEPYNNLGVIYDKKGEYITSINYHLKSLKTNKKYGNQKGEAKSLNNIGNVYLKMGAYFEALEYSNKALILAQKTRLKPEIRNAAKSLWKIHKQREDYPAALTMHELFIQIRDSIESEENQRAIIQQEYKYQYDKQVAMDSLAYNKEQRITKIESDKKDAELKIKRNQQYALLGGLGLTIFFAFLMYNRFRKTREQKVIIEKQKHEVDSQKLEAEKQRDFAMQEQRKVEQQKQIVEEKNSEILNSIDTAKRLRSSILPPVKLVREQFDTSFVIYKSKKIVNSNFYWMEAKEKVILFAVAAYTGSSASSAMISVSCVNSLNKAVNEFNETDPATILNTTFELMKNTFSKSDREIRDNTNITLCVLNESAETLEWAGAKNPLWILIQEKDILEEVELSKRSESNNDVFVTQTMRINGGDSIYIFSDGQHNSFDDNQSKKFRIKEIKKVLFEIRHHSMGKQKQELTKTFESWQGGSIQADDVCMIGVRLPQKENNPFTRREKEVLQHLEQGLSSKIIAEELNISKSTVDTHRKKILRKVNVNSVTELLRVSREKKWL